MTAGVAADPATMPDDTPPTVWTWNKPSGDRFANINRMVNCIHGEPSSQLHERHDADDFDTKTPDKLAPAGWAAVAESVPGFAVPTGVVASPLS